MSAKRSNEASTRYDKSVAVRSQQKKEFECLGTTMMASRFAASARSNRT